MDKKHLEMKQRAMDEANEWAEKSISTWADLYGMLHERMAMFHKAPGQNTSEMALFTMYAFVLALEALPEEGSAIEIVKKMNHILFMEPERMGANIVVINLEDVERTAKVLSALGVMVSTHGEMVAAPQEETPQEVPEPSESPKKMLH